MFCQGGSLGQSWDYSNDIGKGHTKEESKEKTILFIFLMQYELPNTKVMSLLEPKMRGLNHSSQ